MRDAHGRFSVRLAMQLAALGLCLGVAACGGSDDDGSADASQKDATTAGAGAALTAEQKDIAAVMPDQREAFNSANGKAFCANLTAAGKREVREYASEPAVFEGYHTRDCSGFITKYTKKVVIEDGAAHRPVRILAVKSNGDKASVTMKGGLAGIRSIATYKLAKDGGTWKLENPISGAATRRLPEELKSKIDESQ
jgi:hypothetical protein